MRLAYYERIRPTVPEEFVALLPLKPQPNYKFANDEVENAGLAKSLLAKMRSKETSEQLLTYIDGEISPRVASPEVKLEIVTQTLLQAGSKSFSHLLNTIERNIVLFNAIIKTTEQKLAVVQSVAEFWRDSQQHIIILLDKLMTYKIIDGTSIVNWLFSLSNLREFTYSYIWQILSNTINKILARCETLTRELNAAKETGSSDKVKQLTANREQAQREQKELFLVVFQRFSIVLTEHLANWDAQGTDAKTLWFKITSGEFKAVGRRYIAEIKSFLPMLESLLFANADSRVAGIFNQMKLMC